jgi:hypothetical protein
METYTAQQLMAGFSAFTTAGEVAASPIKGEGDGISVMITPTFTPPTTFSTSAVDVNGRDHNPNISVDAMLDIAG